MATGTPTRPPVLNLPNQLTLGRFVLGLVLFGLIEWEQWLACAFVFLLAAFTDWLDGYLARRQGLTSSLGRNLDPLVDNVVICGAYIFLLPIEDSGLTAWAVTVVVARELVITGLRSFLENRGAVFGADWLGKIKMGLQCAVLFGVFGVLLGRDEGWWGGEIPPTVALLRDVLIYLMVGITALSGVQYLWRAALLLKVEE
jgi:CDP-diacylglycerol--glycerol-3-phosphate 3-phosphatidyltransferase